MASPYDAHATDPSLLRKHSATAEFVTGRFTYPSIRVFFKRHEQEDQLPVPLPLLVFVHGLGGSVSQFGSLLTRLSNCASCLAVDLPGCGRSAFAPEDWAAYSFESLVELLEVVVVQYRQPDQGLILIGHSMGCSLTAALASRLPREGGITDSPFSGLVAICPAAELTDQTRIAVFKALLWIPTPVFDLWRAWDNRGGPNSYSVQRFVGQDADEESKLLQERFNRQSKTAVWRRMAWGSLPRFVSGKQVGGLPGKDVWAALDLPVCLIAGECDHITPPREVKKISSFMMSSAPGASAVSNDDENGHPAVALSTAVTAQLATPSELPANAPGQITKTSPRPDLPGIIDIADDDFLPRQPVADDDTPTTPAGTSDKIDIPALRRYPLKFVESHVLPVPAGHALLYTPTTVGVVSGIISNFLARHVTGRLDRGWQLRFLSREGKWDVKNLEKWTRVEPVSRPIAAIFRAMKTLRQVDEVHSPKHFVESWGHVVKDIIDISHDNPVYDPRDLEIGGIHYHKFPTVSKIPPTAAEVEVFNALVDRLRASHGQQATDAYPSQERFIGVHCHYGFNRTGYFIVCYLVDRCNYALQDAIKMFGEARPVGIRHSHFLDALSLRYAKVTDGV